MINKEKINYINDNIKLIFSHSSLDKFIFYSRNFSDFLLITQRVIFHIHFL